ncbi:MAG: hypothetical protein B7X76_06705, partial [Azorhizobium sp. 39-67-5]
MPASGRRATPDRPRGGGVGSRYPHPAALNARHHASACGSAGAGAGLPHRPRGDGGTGLSGRSAGAIAPSVTFRASSARPPIVRDRRGAASGAGRGPAGASPRKPIGRAVIAVRRTLRRAVRRAFARTGAGARTPRLRGRCAQGQGRGAPLLRHRPGAHLQAAGSGGAAPALALDRGHLHRRGRP